MSRAQDAGRERGQQAAARKRFTGTCEVCGKTFATARATAKYCSNAHNHQAQRARAASEGRRLAGSTFRDMRETCIVTFQHADGEVFTCQGIARGAKRHKDARVVGGLGPAKADALAQAERRRGGALGDPQRLHTRVDLPRPQAHGGLT